MFRTKATRRTKRAVSPLRAATNEPAQQESVAVVTQTPANQQETNSTLEKNMTNFFEAESAAVALTKPWLRL